MVIEGLPLYDPAKTSKPSITITFSKSETTTNFLSYASTFFVNLDAKTKFGSETLFAKASVSLNYQSTMRNDYASTYLASLSNSITMVLDDGNPNGEQGFIILSKPTLLSVVLERQNYDKSLNFGKSGSVFCVGHEPDVVRYNLKTGKATDGTELISRVRPGSGDYENAEFAKDPEPLGAGVEAIPLLVVPVEFQRHAGHRGQGRPPRTPDDDRHHGWLLLRLGGGLLQEFLSVARRTLISGGRQATLQDTSWRPRTAWLSRLKGRTPRAPCVFRREPNSQPSRSI